MASDSETLNEELVRQEADHRIGNSLQLVASLLTIQERTVHDDGARAALADARQRIMCVARLHKLLCATAAGDVAVDDYLRALAADLCDTVVDEGRVALLVNVDAIRVPGSLAGTLGLIASELVTNAIKHGFHTGSRGIVQIDCGMDGDGKIALHVTNTGADDAQLSLESRRLGFGTQIIHALLTKYGGSYDIECIGPYVVQKVTLSAT